MGLVGRWCGWGVGFGCGCALIRLVRGYGYQYA
jgi:hypothetical protein